jgi:hypothetical protein
VNSRDKGKRGELEACRALRALGLDAERTVQHEGRGSAGDVRVFGCNAHLEVKLREQFTVYKHMAQAIRDCRPGGVPAVLLKQNRSPFLLMLQLSDWWRLVDEFETAKGHAALGCQPAAVPMLEVR